MENVRKQTPSRIDMILESQRRLLGAVSDLSLQLQTLLSVKDGVMRFVHMDREFRVALPEAATDPFQRRVVASGGFPDIRLLDAVAARLGQGCVVVDAGAGIGVHTLYFAACLPGSCVYAFEPRRIAYGTLEANIRFNGLDNVMSSRSSLGERTQRLPEGSGQVTTLDSLALDRLDLLRIGTADMQLETLKGGEASIARHRPLVLAALSGDGVKRWLWDHGYECRRQDGADWLCVPRDSKPSGES